MGHAFYKKRQAGRRCAVSAPFSAELGALQKAKASLSAARELSPSFPEFSASRAYYAMFYGTTALLLHKGLSFKRHSAVIAAFGREFAKENPTWREHHKHFIRAELLRLEGDYDL